MLLAYIIDAKIMSFFIKNNMDKSIYISQNFYLSQIQELTYPNIEQLYSQKATLAKQIPYNEYKKA